MLDHEIGKKAENTDEQEGQVPGIIIRRFNLKEAGCHLFQISSYRKRAERENGK